MGGSIKRTYKSVWKKCVLLTKNKLLEFVNVRNTENCNCENNTFSAAKAERITAGEVQIG